MLSDRELDALVAEKIFGEIKRLHADMEMNAIVNAHGVVIHVHCVGCGWSGRSMALLPKVCVGKAKNYSGDIEKSYLVVDAMRKRGFNFECNVVGALTNGREDAADIEPYMAHFWPIHNDNDQDYRWASGPHLPSAIALAALKALGVEVDG